MLKTMKIVPVRERNMLFIADIMPVVYVCVHKRRRERDRKRWKLPYFCPLQWWDVGEHMGQLTKLLMLALQVCHEFHAWRPHVAGMNFGWKLSHFFHLSLAYDAFLCVIENWIALRRLGWCKLAQLLVCEKCCKEMYYRKVLCRKLGESLCECVCNAMRVKCLMQWFTVLTCRREKTYVVILGSLWQCKSIGWFGRC